MAKLDLVAVPDLFYPAMEDWALILFKVRGKSPRENQCHRFVGRRNADQ